MRLFSRHNVALILIAVHLTIVMGPLAPFAALRSHALTGECAEDCMICGCSPERSASHTCCCWQKRVRRAEAEAVLNGEQHDCCKKKQHRPAGATISEHPCGSADMIALAGTDQDDLLPFHFAGPIIGEPESVHAQLPRGDLADCHVIPPDPPPETVSLS